MRDGTSNTVFCGEKSINPDRYDSWTGYGNAQNMYIGYGCDNVRFGGPRYPLRQDQPGVDTPQAFSGPHPGGCQFAFCDGSVRLLSYGIDDETYRRACDRADAQPVRLP